MTAPFIPDNAPFSADQRAWLNGFFAGIFSRSGVQAAATPAAATLQPLTILFGSQTGTAESLAKRLGKEAGKRGFAPTVVDMASMDLARLAAEKNVLVITSTYGDGEPPDNARVLWNALGGATAPTLGGLRYSVCSLGDRNYAQFCKCGQEFDARLEKLGATRVAARVDCDVDYEAAFSGWLGSALGALGSGGAAPALAPSPAAAAPAEEAATGYSRKNPYPALLLTSRRLNADGSAKEVRHIEFDLADSGLTYEAGDALGVVAQNCPEEVDALLAALGCDGEEAVATGEGQNLPLRLALARHFDLGKPSPELVSAFSARAGSGGVATALAPHHVIDVVAAYPSAKVPPGEFVSLLRRLQPRLYSISSSPKAHPGQVHLTVGAVRYETQGRARKGVCSTFLADRAIPGDTRAGIFVHSSKGFRVPTNPNTPMIMVGPGTGIAPFRAFLEEREATGAKGKNWLFFGDQRASTDFLYREELEAMRGRGLLTRLDTAFSRDQTEKVYVQHRMLENAAELWSWLEAGAHFYVCGDASRMAKDVDAALHQVVQTAGGRSPDQAAAYVDNLKAAKRYARDVY
jgi:sulfite reductase (NADPH) flavoprotein alpha-component